MRFQQILSLFVARPALGPRGLVHVFLLSLLVLGGQSALSQTFTNPIAPPLSADPSIVVDNGTYYFTSTDGRGSIDVQGSTSLATLGSAPKVDVFNPCCGYEHPSLWKLRGNWFMLWDDGNGNGVVMQSSGDPYGPWQVINGKVCSNFCRDLAFLYLNDQLWLLYSEGSVGYEIRIQPMTDPATPSGGSTAIISRDPQDSNDWEWAGGAPYGCGCIESPFPVQHNGTLSIVYSGNYYGGPNYGLGLAVFNGGDVTNPGAWTNRGKVFGTDTNTGVYGPGTTSIFRAPDSSNNDEAWFAYDAWSDGCGVSCDGDQRTTRVQQIRWQSDGTPGADAPVSTSTQLPLPSGDPGP